MLFRSYRTFRTDRVAAAEARGERYPGRRSDWLRAWRKLMEQQQSSPFTPDKN